MFADPECLKISNVCELQQLICSEAICGYQVRGKIPFDPNIISLNNINLTGLHCVNRCLVRIRCHAGTCMLDYTDLCLIQISFC